MFIYVYYIFYAINFYKYKEFLLLKKFTIRLSTIIFFNHFCKNITNLNYQYM